MKIITEHCKDTNNRDLETLQKEDRIFCSSYYQANKNNTKDQGRKEVVLCLMTLPLSPTTDHFRRSGLFHFCHSPAYPSVRCALILFQEYNSFFWIDLSLFIYKNQNFIHSYFKNPGRDLKFSRKQIFRCKWFGLC